MARGQCLCGDVVYEVEGPFTFAHDCHCSRCRKSHGTGSASFAAVPVERFRWVKGEEGIRYWASSKHMRRAFCGRCGSQVPGGDVFDGITFFPIGALEGDFQVEHTGHIFARSKAPWDDITDGGPTFDAYPPGLEVEVQPDFPRPPPAPGRARGSCLCGGLAWEIEGEPLFLRRCHCLRCRRARAHSHAANAAVAKDALHWIAGERDVVLYKLPEAERFSQAFCGTCGAKAPWFIEARDAWNVPLGALDDDPGAKPSEHIFVGSKAHWFEITDGLPQWEEYPEG